MEANGVSETEYLVPPAELSTVSLGFTKQSEKWKLPNTETDIKPPCKVHLAALVLI